MQSPSPSPLERMRKLSIFRSKSDQSPSTDKRRISDVLSSSRSKASDPGTNDDSGPSPNAEPQASSLPLNPRSSVEQEPSSGSQLLSNSLEPDLPSVRSDDGYYVEETAPNPSSIARIDSSGLDEHDMARRLMDVESSFLPDRQSPYQRPKLSTTDTALYLPRESVRMSTNRALAKSHEQGNFGERVSRKSTQPSLNGETNRAYLSSDGLSSSRETPPMGIQPPMQHQMSTSGGLEPYDGDEILSHPIPRTQQSSPTVAAVERSKVRATAGAIPSRNTPTKEIQRKDPLVMSPAVFGPEAGKPFTTSEESRPDSLLRSDQTTSMASIEPQGQHMQRSASFDDLSTVPQVQSRKSPTIDQTRQSTRHSSTSSFHSAQAQSDVISIADVGMSGEQTPASLSTVRQSRELSRLPSFGSIASSISGREGSISGNSRKRDLNGNMIRSSHSNLGRLAEEGKRESQSPETPQATPSATIAPTDTILAKHVRSVQVPNTVAKAYKASNPPNTLQRFDLISTPQPSKGKDNLTLKEQNSRIDKLSKENFDLKLKIHYLYQALQDRSDEGVKEMAAKIAQLQTDLIKTKKDNQVLRKRVRELDRQHSTRNNDLSVPSSHREESEGDGSSASFKYAQLEDEIVYLRNRMQSLDEDNQKLQASALTKEAEKRRLIDQLRRLEATDHSNGSLKGGQSKTWTALLDNEVDRREQAEREVEALAEELSLLKSNYSKDTDRASQLHNDHFDYAKQPPRSAGTTIYSGSTLVEQLKIENADLRRDLGAQTSMLTSRNRERERLQQEIEDLKMVERRAGGAKSSESLFVDRGASRANERPMSRQSAPNTDRQLNDADQEQYETALADLRDDNAVLKMRCQDLHMELNNTRNTLQELESELADADTRADEDRAEAQQLIDQLEDLVGDKQQEISELELDLQRRDDEANTLRREIQTIKDSLNRVVGDCENRQGENVGLQRSLTNANGEIEALETSLREANSAKDRLEVQAESLRGEIAFLREEQESDKIKIGDLQTALRVAKNADRDNQERLKELEDLEEEISQARQEARQLKKALAAKDLEVTSARDKLEEVENGLRRALGDDVGSSTSMLHEVIRLQRDFENTLQDHDSIKGKLLEKERLLKDREALLESSGLETRRLNDLLDKERQGRKHDQNEHAREKRNLVRPSELDTSPIAGRKKIAHLESKHGEAIRMRDTLLLDASTRLSALCGRDWTAKHGLKGAPTLDTIAASIPSVNTTISSALATLESSLPDLKSRIRSTERHLVRDYAALEKVLADRSAHLDDLEKILTTNRTSIDSTSANSIELARMKDENRHLKRELKFLKQGSFALPGLPSPQDDLEHVAPRDLQPPSLAQANPDPNSLPTLREKNPRRVDHRSDLDHQLSGGGASGSKTNDAVSSKDVDAIATTTSPRKNQHLAFQHGPGSHQSRQVYAPLTAGEQTMMLKLQALQRQLTAEREGRVLDRKGARTRLKEGEGERERLKAELANEKARSRARGEELGGASGAGDGDIQ